MDQEQRLKHRQAMREYYHRNKERFKEYNRERREKIAAYMREYQTGVPEEVKGAWWTVAYAIKKGRLVRAKTCENCGSDGKIEAHHFKGYAKEHWLDIQWLCKMCHGAEQQGKDLVKRTRAYQPGYRPFGLTVKELQIALLAAEGMTRDEVCKRLGISRQTSNTHYDNLFKKLGVHSHRQLMAKWSFEVGKGWPLEPGNQPL